MIKDRLDSGEIDPTGETERPRGIRNIPDDPATTRARTAGRVDDRIPAAASPDGNGAPPASTAFTQSPVAPEPTPSGGLTRPGLRLTADEIRSMSGLSGPDFDTLLSYGVVAPGPSGDFGEDALEVATISKRSSTTASTPATCAAGAWPPTARPGCSNSWSSR